MKNLITITLILFSLIKLSAQVGSTKEEIIEEYGTKYITEKTDDNTPYIFYVDEFKTKVSGKYMRYTYFYFTETKNKELKCFLRKIIEPFTELNAFVENFNNKAYVKISELKWKNYENNLIYNLEVDDVYCTLRVYID